MIRQIIHIDEEKCIGCGLCADACHEGAIAMVNGKAKLMREDYCDGLGDCLPACPADAISFVTREAPAYDAAAVEAAKLEKAAKTPAAATSSIISGLKLLMRQFTPAVLVLALSLLHGRLRLMPARALLHAIWMLSVHLPCPSGLFRLSLFL